MSYPLNRFVVALPDALTAATYALCWVAPAWLGYPWIKTLMIVMLMEFFVVHSGAFFKSLWFDQGGTTRRALSVLGVGGFYLVFIAAISMAIEAWWPFWAFLWLLLAKAVPILLRPQPPLDEVQRQFILWALSVAAYIGAVALTAMLPIPALGIDAAARAGAAISGSGLWVEQPQTVLAAGLLYFALLAWAKAYGIGETVR